MRIIPSQEDSEDSGNNVPPKDTEAPMQPPSTLSPRTCEPRKRPTPGTCGWTGLSTEQETYVLTLNLGPKLGGKFINPAKWKALMTVQVADLPRLMREGLYWSADNVHPEEGFCRHNDLEPVFLQQGWDITRRYYLSNPRVEEAPLWTAWLIVYAKSSDYPGLVDPYSTPTLSQFRLSELSPDMVRLATAFNREDQRVYYWSVHHPEQEFNAIYDDLPLDGWWPWPKREEMDEEKEKEPQEE